MKAGSTCCMLPGIGVTVANKLEMALRGVELSTTCLLQHDGLTVSSAVTAWKVNLLLPARCNMYQYSTTTHLTQPH